MHVSQLNIYPLKSTSPQRLTSSVVTSRGLQHDRRWLLIDENNQFLTGRQYPQLLKVKATVTTDGLSITSKSDQQHFRSATYEEIDFQFFKERLNGHFFSIEADQWFSDYLGITCRLVYQADIKRPVLEKRGGQLGDIVNYADEAPVLLAGEASLEDLNSRLDQSITMARFRPNIVIKGAEAYAEDEWKYIKLGGCKFQVAQVCKRCVFTTIDPETLEKNPNGEPLKTLATYRKLPSGGVIFGVHMIPRKLGEVKLGDEVEVIR